MKKNLTLSIEKTISDEFKKLCIDENISVSKEIENYMEKKIGGKK